MNNYEVTSICPENRSQGSVIYKEGSCAAFYPNTFGTWKEN